MRWAVIADCHGNVDALRAVLARIDAVGVDLILNLGDHASGPLAARETIDVIRARDDMVSIRGNHDRYLLGDVARMGPSDAAAVAELSEVHLDWLAALPATRVVEDVFLCHGMPHSDETYWLEDVTSDGHVVRRDLPGIVAAAEGVTEQVMLCGHTHLPGIVTLPDGRVVVNPGSAGVPAYDDVTPVPHVVQSGDAAARYALMERREGLWDITLHRVPYDPARMAALARNKGRADWAGALESGWFPSGAGDAD